MNNIKKIVYAPKEKAFVIECVHSDNNILKECSSLSEVDQLLFFNLWTACRLQVPFIKYLVYNHENKTLYIEPLDVSISSVLLDEAQRKKLDEVLVICKSLIV